MANLKSSKTVRKRITSVKNLGKITKSMQMIASIKVAKITNQLKVSQKYISESYTLLQQLAITSEISHPYVKSFGNEESYEEYLQNNENEDLKSELLLLFSSSRGLCGAYNSKIFSLFNNYIAQSNHKIIVLCVGKKSVPTIKRHNLEVVALFEKITDEPSFDEILPVFQIAEELFLEGKISKVSAIYTKFHSTLRQEVVHEQILPIGQMDENFLNSQDHMPTQESDASDNCANNDTDNGKEKEELDFIFEPSKSEVIEQVLPFLIKNQIYSMLLNASASEHSNRFIAMQNSTDNASEIGRNLVIQYNKARQGAITQEISEIVGGITAMS